MTIDRGSRSIHKSLCMYCVYRYINTRTRAVMLTTYCITDEQCDGCKRTADLSLCAVPHPKVVIPSTWHVWLDITPTPTPEESAEIDAWVESLLDQDNETESFR